MVIGGDSFSRYNSPQKKQPGGADCECIVGTERNPGFNAATRDPNTAQHFRPDT